MELVDVTDSKSVGLITRVGSSPTTGTRLSLNAVCVQALSFAESETPESGACFLQYKLSGGSP